MRFFPSITLNVLNWNKQTNKKMFFVNGPALWVWFLHHEDYVKLNSRKFLDRHFKKYLMRYMTRSFVCSWPTKFIKLSISSNLACNGKITIENQPLYVHCSKNIPHFESWQPSLLGATSIVSNLNVIGSSLEWGGAQLFPGDPSQTNIVWIQKQLIWRLMNETNEPVDHPIKGFLGHKGHEVLPRGNVEEMWVLLENSTEGNVYKQYYPYCFK